MVETRTVAVLLLVVGGVSVVAGGLGYLAVTVDGGAGQPTDETTVPESIAAVHDAGITGENVSVGVLDVTGFETDTGALDGRVVETRQFGAGGDAVGGDRSHGTATAATIARLAPDASLYLGRFETVEEYAAALDWLVEQDVDVVVTPVAYAGTLGDGASELAQATTNATEQGITVVAPAGNLGQGHWRGEYTPTDDGVHAFDGRPLNRITGPAGRAEFWLTTDGDPEAYQLELHEITGGNETRLVAQSVPHDSGSVPSERLTVRLDDGRYALVVRGPENETDARIRVASATHSLAQVRPAGSVTAPAVAPGALSVGAVDPATNRTAPYSSRGPTLDGRLGVHVVAPSSLSVSGVDSFTGTSASASFVGGVVALLVDASPGLAPADVRTVVTSTAEPIDGVDAVSGHGRIVPDEAVAAALELGGSERRAEDRGR